MSTFTKLFGTHSERELKRIYPIVDKVESYRDQMAALSDDELKAKTKEYKERLEKGETLDDLLPEAYATVREAAEKGFEQRCLVDKRIVEKTKEVKKIAGSHDFAIGIPDKKTRKELAKEYYLGQEQNHESV